MPFAAVTQLSALDGTNGFQINGVAFRDEAGWSVASAGDINGDGIDDLIIGARFADPNGDRSGASYVVFGSAAGFGANFELSALNGSNGFRIHGAATNNLTGYVVSSAGDVNDDGFDDLIVGAPGASPNGVASGASYVVFGSDAGFAPTLELSTLDGTSGFRLVGAGFANNSGFSVASAGDINGDSVADLIIGAYGAGPNGRLSGASYVVFGSGAGFAPTLQLSALDGSNGFRIAGASSYDYSGMAVASAGDVNGDGIDDLIIGAPFANRPGTDSGAAYVVFGSNAGFAATVELSGLDGTNGFELTGAAAQDRTGRSVAGAGDVNGDGFDDLIIGAPYADPGAYSYDFGAAYVVFGKASFAASVALASTANGTSGFAIQGEASNNMFGISVASAGDLNGDGYGDLVVGAPNASLSGDFSGLAYVVFGRASGFGSLVAVSSLNGTDGFKINGEFFAAMTGRSVAAAGDINGDGADDLIIGAHFAGPNGQYSGAAYVIYGQPPPITYVGGAGDDLSSGGSQGDSLSGGGGKDTLNGLGGDDILDGGDSNDLLNGGDGADDLIGGLGGDTLFGDAGADELSGGDGADKLYGGTGGDLLNGGTGNDRMDGQSDIDTLNGGGGNDYLDGGLGADIMTGGAENDVYIVDNAGDQTIELLGEGYDIVRTTLNWVLADNLEALELQGNTNAAATGNSGANNLQGNIGGNTLSGLAGVDTINGNDGDDIVIGGQGNDLLRGGLGLDTFRVEHAFSGVLETDQIYDFSTAEGDIMDFSALFAGTIARVNSFTGVAGQMTLAFAAGITTVRLDIDGNGVAEYQAKINGDVTADYGGWLL